MSNSRSPSIALITLLVGFTIAANPVTAQSVEDFRKAAKAGGCDLIPYPSLKKDCKDAKELVDEYKKRPYSCKGIQDEIDDLKKNGARKERTEELIKKARTNMQILQKYRSSRKAVSDAFAKAKSMLKRESDETIKPLSEDIIDLIEAQEAVHADAIVDLENAIGICENAKW